MMPFTEHEGVQEAMKRRDFFKGSAALILTGVSLKSLEQSVPADVPDYLDRAVTKEPLTIKLHEKGKVVKAQVFEVDKGLDNEVARFGCSQSFTFKDVMGEIDRVTVAYYGLETDIPCEALPAWCNGDFTIVGPSGGILTVS